MHMPSADPDYSPEPSSDHHLLTASRLHRDAACTVTTATVTTATVTNATATNATATNVASAQREGLESGFTDPVLWALPVPVAVLDTRGAIVAVNHEWNRLAHRHGPPALAGQSVGRNYLDTCRQAGGQIVAGGRDAAAGIQAVLHGSRRHFALEYRCQAPTGQRWFLLQAAPLPEPRTGAVVTHTDITSRRQMDRELIEDSGQLERIFEAMADGLASFDAAGRLVHMNAAYRRLLGPAAAKGLDALARRAHGQQEAPLSAQGRAPHQIQRPLYRILRGETLSDDQAVDVQVHGKNRRVSEVSVSGAPLRDEMGRINGAVTSLRDVTTQRRIEADRAHMVSTVSHELKNPLNVLRLGLDLLRRSAERGDQVKGETLELLETGVSLMDRLVSDLVDAARMETGHLMLRLAPTDLEELIHRVAEEQAAIAGRPILVEAPKRPLRATVDALRIAQALTNLLSNAMKYSPLDAPVRVRLHRERRQAYIEVHDEGPGIASEAHEHLFERFYRVPGVQVLHGTGVGLGLGLYICRGLVELHAGRIGVRSEVGHGSAFWFSLPLA